ALKGSGANGACGYVMVGTDPKSECPDDGADGCGRDGTCDGSGQCRLYVKGTPCSGAQGCAADAMTCDGLGACACGGAASCDGDHTATDADGKTLDCSPYRCQSNGTCKRRCDSIDDCTGSNVCDATGQCAAPIAASTGGGSCSCREASGDDEVGAWFGVVAM